MSHPSWTFPSELGRWCLTWSPTGVRVLRPAGQNPIFQPKEIPEWVSLAVGDLCAHFAGAPKVLASIPLDESVFTPFQGKVAKVLRATCPGQTLTYGDIAFRTGRPGAARAVGQAVKRNPLLVLVPCHRVVAAQGPGGWSAFGSPGIKERLLGLESPDNGTDAAPTS